MSNTSSSAGGGIGFCGLLGIVFIVLKLCKIIDWDWLWVLAPIWGPAAFVVFLLLVWLAAIGIRALSERRHPDRRVARELRNYAQRYNERFRR